MTAEAKRNQEKRLEPRRALHMALGGAVLQLGAALVLAVLAYYTQSLSLQVLRWQVAIGVIFWGLTYLHLRLRQSARDEAWHTEQAERQRRQQGMQKLFEEEELGLAARNLKHMERFGAPVAGVLVSVFLLLPALTMLVLSWGKRFITVIKDMPPIEPEYALLGAVGSVIVALGFLLAGFYAAGLAREPRFRLLRAGAGYMLSSSVFLFASMIALALTRQGWLGDWPDRVVAMVVWAWMTFQALEILINLVLDFYRPRVAGVEARPCYDSRISGLLAEPQGLFRTFAHTLDYQFGFRVSDTWFFRFLEKALVPLIAIQLVTFYLLSSFVVVRPGEAAIIEYWGAPRGVTSLPVDDAAWDTLPAPLGPGFYFKWPWPIEQVRILPREQVSVMHAGFASMDETEAAKKVETLTAKVVSWDVEHVEDEFKYLMPMPPEMQAAKVEKRETVESEIDLTSYEGRGGEIIKRAASGDLPDVLFLSGLFTLQYQVGENAGDVYRYLYLHKDARKTLRAIFERELTQYTAGANFWNLMVDSPDEAQERILSGVRQTAAQARLGVKILALDMQNVHPPVGDVGKAYQGVLAAREQKEAMIYGGEAEARSILGVAPSDALKQIREAEAYRFNRSHLAEAEAFRFVKQMEAYAAAPEAYMLRLQMATLEDALAQPRKVVLPKGVTPFMDDTKLLTPTGVEEALVKEAQNP